MENALFFTSFILNITLCIFSFVSINKLILNGTIRKGAAIVLYALCAVLIAYISGVLVIDWLLDFYQGHGFAQDFGHGGYVMMAILNMGIAIFGILLGVVKLKSIGRTN